ncbi:AAA family ATPase [Dactylosporangium sp. NPDC051485]|uniref:helix-turn-helix transcriptional regulator n=1 Tax=Dactylosporangium sp. NPDC051485 TaxID=3154846 RepID=UPI00343AF409
MTSARAGVGLLVEREAELAAMADRFEEALAGRGQLVLVSGPVGSGKTALLQAFADHVVGSRARVLRAVGSRAERTLSLGVVGQLFRHCDLSPEGSERVSRLLDDGAFSSMINDGDGETGGEVSAHVLQGLCLAMLQLAEQHPLVVVLDDVHYVDGASLQWLSYLVRRLRQARVLVVCNEATRLVPVHPAFHAELLHEPRTTRIRLGPLSRTGVQQVLAPTPRTAATRTLAADCHRITGGNPSLLRGLIADSTGDRGAAPGHLVVGAGFAQALVICLYRCEFTLLKVARALAVLDEPASMPLLGRLADVEPELAQRAVEALNAAGFLDDGQFRHPAARAAVLDGMVPEERAAMHLRAARLLNSDAAPAVVVARHLLLADFVEDPWIPPVLHEAADHALAIGDVNAAISFLRLAHQIGGDEAQRAVSEAALARAEWRLNPQRTARHLTDLAGYVRAGHLTGRDALSVVDWLLWFGRVDKAVALLDIVGRSADRLDAESIEGLSLSRLWTACAYPGAGRTDVCPATGPATTRLQAGYLLVEVLTRGPTARCVAEAEQILHGSRLDERTIGPIGVALAALVYGDQLGMAAQRCDALLHEAEGRRAPTWHAVLAALRAEIALRQGDLRVAEDYARAALAVIPPKAWGVAIGAPLSTLLHACTAMGRYDDAVTHLRMPVPDALFQTPIGLHYLQARGRYFRTTGRHSAALADFQTIGELMTAWEAEIPAFVPWWGEAAETHLALGRPREAHDLIVEQLRRLQPGHVRTRAISLRILAATGDPRRTELLQRAVTALQSCGDRLELAYALTDLSQAQQDDGNLGQARVTRRRARELAKMCGAFLGGLDPAADPLGSAPPAPPTPVEETVSELSDAERRVAVLAAQGHTNRQISDKLYVTVSTVEQHLTRVYRKLNINSRADLPLRLNSDVVGWPPGV